MPWGEWVHGTWLGGNGMNSEFLEELKRKIAPCSLMCHTCSAYYEGVICEASKTLLKYLDGMEGFYEKHIPAAVTNYHVFEKLLKRYASGPCSGCRTGIHNGCTIEGCFLLDCVEKHGVDYCGECDEFPCGKPQTIFEEQVYDKWLMGNSYIKAHGVEAYWEEFGASPHYEAYKNND